MKVQEESEKAGLKLNIQKTKIMTSSPITSWQIDGEKMKQWQILFSSVSAIRVVSSAYLRLLIFLPVILIPACASSSPAFGMAYSYGSAGKESAYDAGDLGLIPGLGRSPGEGKGYPL